MTDHEADAATLRTLAARMERRGEDGLATLTRQMADWVEQCVEVPDDLVRESVRAAKTEVN